MMISTAEDHDVLLLPGVSAMAHLREEGVLSWLTAITRRNQEAGGYQQSRELEMLGPC
jgi:hypothetical protein